MSKLTSLPMLCSRADLKVRTMFPTSRMARSTLPLLFESPTLLFSRLVPTSALRLAISCCNSTMDDSWSVLTMIRSFANPTVVKSSTIWSAIQGSSATLLLLNAYAQTESHIVSLRTKHVRLTAASSFSMCSFATRLTFSLRKQ